MLRNKAWLRWGVAALATTTIATAAVAADHLDGPGVKMDPAADITDVYSWVDNGKVNLVLNVSPLATTSSKFSDKVAYVIHTASGDAFGATTKEVDIICTFDAAQTASCWVGDQDYVSGNASSEAGITSASGKVKVFAGLRDDPFFFNLEGFNDAVKFVTMNKNGLDFSDPTKCPKIDNQTSGIVVNMLKSTSEGAMPPKDFFAGLNVLSIVIQVDASLLNAGGKIMSVWGSTNELGG